MSLASDDRRLVLRVVDPHFGRDLGRLRRAFDEALRMLVLGGMHHPSALREEGQRVSAVNEGGGEPGQAFVVVSWLSC